MIYRVNSGVFIKTLNALISFSDPKGNINFLRVDSGLVLYRGVSLFFRIPLLNEGEACLQGFTVAVSDIKPVSTLTASVVEEEMTLEITGNYLSIKSNVAFEILASPTNVSPDTQFSIDEEIVYQDTEVIKTLSKYLSKFSKDNFKGCFICGESGFILPGNYHLTHIPATLQSSPQAYALKSSQLNKLTKLGQDISILSDGRIVSDDDTTFVVTLPKAPKESSIGNRKGDLDESFISELPSITILQPKVFKTFLKNTKSEDKQYDLCSLRTESERVVINFYRDKQASNSFTYSYVETPDSFVEVYLQTKHLLALTELATEKLELQFSSTFEPLKVVIDGTYTSYLMQGVVR